MADNRSIDGKLSVDLLEARAIHLVDESGAVRASCSCAADDTEKRGHVVIHLYDRDGRPRLSLQVDDEEGPSVSLFNQTNSPCVSLGVMNNRGNGISICDSEGKPRIRAGAGDVGSTGAAKQAAEIIVRNSDGDVVWAIDG